MRLKVQQLKRGNDPIMRHVEGSLPECASFSYPDEIAK
jgi:hypothetical protein